MSRPTILCATYGGGHVNACLPVAEALNARGWDVHFLALTTAYAAVLDSGASAAGITVWQARDLISEGEDALLGHGVRLAGDAPSDGPVSREETIAYHALGYHDLMVVHGEGRAAALYAKKGRAAFEHGELAARICDRIQPDLVLTTNSPRAEKAVIELAQKRNIPAVVLNDTLASETNHWLHNRSYADAICVLGDPVRDVLIASGHAAEKVVVTGNPALEPMRKLSDRRNKRTEGRHHKVVLYASQPLVGEDKLHQSRVIAELTRIAGTRDDLELRARLHPNEPQDPDWLRPPLHHVQTAALADDLLAANVLVTHGSTVGIEAALAGVPVVLQLGSSVAQNCRFEEYGIAMVSQKVTDLETAIDRALLQGFATSFSMPPNAIGNVVAVLEEMLDS